MSLMLHANEINKVFNDISTTATNGKKGTEDKLLDNSVLNNDEIEESNSNFVSGFTGKITEQVVYSPYTNKPHDNISSLKSSFFLDYEHKFENNLKIKINTRAYYDAIYDIKGSEKFSQKELNAYRSEIELYDAYIEGSITDKFDIKLGRQVVVWGRSDTLRVTDILNPLDNRQPGMLDIEYLRLPVTMAKFDYFVGNWRITPIAILEQRFSKNPSFGSVFYPISFPLPEDESYSDITYALSVGGEFNGWDVNFYAARILDDEGYFVFLPKVSKEHEKVNMFGTAINILTGPWLFKTELAYFDGLKYTTVRDKSFTRTDMLLGVEYSGINDTYISYDIVNRSIGSYDEKLLNEYNPLHKHNYQSAFRIRSDFMNATLTANYLITLYGKELDEGGFQRLWIEYELDDGVTSTVSIVDYMGDSPLMQKIKDNDMIFVDLSYSF